MPTGRRRAAMFSKADIKTLYRLPRSQHISGKELHERASFIYNTIVGCDRECEDFYCEFIPFQYHYGPRWDRLFKRHTSSNRTEWAQFEEDRLDFVDDQSRIINTFPYPNRYSTATVVPRPSSQVGPSLASILNLPPRPHERFVPVEDVAFPLLHYSELLPTEATSRESLLKLYARWNQDSAACAYIEGVHLQIDDTDMSVELHLQAGILYAVNDGQVYAVDVETTYPLSLLYRK